ncbi:MAG: BrnT family toxin [Caulobacter sp.]|nr:BrnT family toxin [Caulobacter sp.]
MSGFEWDPEKARSNLAKHGIAFDEAKRVWDDPGLVVYDGGVIDGEQRWRAIGAVGLVTILFVVFVYRGPLDEERVRIISARRATPRERKEYAQANL